MPLHPTATQSCSLSRHSLSQIPADNCLGNLWQRTLCLCLLEVDFSPTGWRWGGNSTVLWRAPWMVHGVWGARLGTGTLSLAWGHSSCPTSGSPTPWAASQCQDAATSPGAASNSGNLLRNSRVGTDQDHGGHGCPDRHCPCHCPTAEGHRAPTEPVPPGMAPCPCAGPQ